jgi:predicted CXXCH cytochrome family protein
MKTTKLFLAIVLVALASLALPTAAFANFAIHGNYVTDTDACAGCHRTHTSVSTIGWTDTDNTQHSSALLVTSATEMWQFCYACHDATSQGADTNVQQGIYEGSLYGTQDAILNGGGFDSLGTGPNSTVTSTHMYKGGSWGAYGGGYAGMGKVGANGAPPQTGTGNLIKMDCATCHDPHGSANYRILKAVVNGNEVGKYTTGPTPQDPNPDGFVSSVEAGWPVNGFRLHTAYPAYTPNYTTPMYAKGYDMTQVSLGTPAADLNTKKGMSGWCSGCHSTYLGQLETVSINGTDYASFASTYNAGDDAGMALRHRHPINVPLTNYKGPDADQMVTDNTSGLPLAHAINEQGAPANSSGDWIECLTCHRAHGTAAQMTGYASNAGAALVISTDGVARNNFPARGINGVTPSNLLRYDNRGVCERCHNK